MKKLKILSFLILVVLVSIFLVFYLQPLNGKQSIDTESWSQIIPSSNLPEKVKTNASNNNLDIVLYKEKYYQAIRTAPTHFASKETKLYIISTKDFENWEFENEIALNNDKREPRFCVYHDTLFFYFFEGGNKFYKFEPQKVWGTFTTGNKEWNTLVDINLDGYVPWRFRTFNDTIYLSAYYGKDIYNKNHKGDLRLFISTNGIKFTPLSKEPQTPLMGGEEGEFIFDDDGNLFATVRLEGDGVLLVKATNSNISEWKAKYTKHKFDSALLFKYNNEIYLISRRNLDGYASKGKYRMYNLIRYSVTKKKTALFRFNKETIQLEWLMDFPSTGDNAFPAIAEWNVPGKMILLNYSNDIFGKELNWIRGQFNKTNIYKTVLDMEEISKLEPLAIFE
jgi:hypothetical protein